MPRDGLFPTVEAKTSRQPLYLTPQCGQCQLYRSCQSPRMPVNGEGRRGILVVAEAPGKTEDSEGIPLCGKTGQLLERTLRDFGIDMRRDCWLTNAARCRPPNNATPTDQQIAWCRPYLTATTSDKYGDIARLQPTTIILLGGVAVKSIIGWLWKEDAGGINRWAGFRIPSQQLNAWVCPTWHPSFVSREEEKPVVNLMWRRHLEAAVCLKKRPWKTLPDYGSRIAVEVVPRQAAMLVREIVRMGKPAAVDFETNRLKPDSSDAEIVTCSISNGVITVAYPWHGAAIEATRKFLFSPLTKIMSNEKFERRWARRMFGEWIRGQVFDTMQAAHFLDNRPEVSSIKFQAFALLGQSSWDDAVKPYFQSKGPNVSNRIHDFIRDHGLKALLTYNGYDSLLEWEVAKIQAKKIGVELADIEEE